MARVKLKFGQLHATMLCQYTAFGEVVAGLFGDKKSGRGNLVPGEFTDLAQAPSFDMALAAINNALKVG